MLVPRVLTSAPDVGKWIASLSGCTSSGEERSCCPFDNDQLQSTSYVPCIPALLGTVKPTDPPFCCMRQKD